MLHCICYFPFVSEKIRATFWWETMFITTVLFHTISSPRSFVRNDTLSLISPNLCLMRHPSLYLRALPHISPYDVPPYTGHTMTIHPQQPKGARTSLMDKLHKTPLQRKDNKPHCSAPSHQEEKWLPVLLCPPHGWQHRTLPPHSVHSAP